MKNVSNSFKSDKLKRSPVLETDLFLIYKEQIKTVYKTFLTPIEKNKLLFLALKKDLEIKFRSLYFFELFFL